MTDVADSGSDSREDSPQLRVLAQIVKDLSFENPDANKVTPANASEPSIDLGIEVNANSHSAGEGFFEVDLTLKARATRDSDVMFIAELVYSGLFQLKNIPAEEMEPILLVDCPRLLFPFARRIMADVTREGGYPPLMIDPVDFVGLYRQQQRERSTN